MINIRKLKDMMDDEGIISCFAGPLSQTLVEEIGKVIRHSEVFKDNITKITENMLFSVFIEQSQNIINYMKGKKVANKIDSIFYNSSFIALAYCDDRYCLTSGNLVEKQDVSNVIESMECVRNCSKDTLKKLYKEQIRKERDMSKIGAGLGFIDMARKSSKNIEYCFYSTDTKYIYFLYTVYV